MLDFFRPILIKILRLPPEPPAPFGEYESVRVFRAAPNYFTYRLVLWGIGRTVAFAMLVGGVIFSATALRAWFENQPALLMIVAVLEIFAVISFFFYLGVSFLTLRLDYEMRWYKVTDRSLRIREGVMSVREMTMTFANIQNIKITQGPIQRLLGISDLMVQTAGGGGVVTSDSHEGGVLFNMHVGYFRGVDNAEEVLALMQERLRKQRTAGLGDSDDVEQDEGETEAPQSNLLDAARAMLEEARAMRLAAESRR